MAAAFLNHPSSSVRAQSLRASQPFDANGAREVLDVIATCPAYSRTPLVKLSEAAALLGVSEVWAKDERARLGLSSFKALGGSFAVLMLAAERVAREQGQPIAVRELLRERRNVDVTFATATAGNHGRSVAVGASLVGARAVIFVPEGVPSSQVQAISASGADIVHVGGTYDRAVQACRERAAREGWVLVLDTSYAGYTDAPLRVMQGYLVLVAEVLEQLVEPPTHVLVQAGVGALAATTAAHLSQGAGAFAPRTIVVEPDRAACLFGSAQAGRPVKVPFAGGTNMGRLECYEPSLLAWEILSGLAAAFVTVSDVSARQAAERLARAALTTSPSGAAGLAGLLEIKESEPICAALGLGPESRVVCVITEQAP